MKLNVITNSRPTKNLGTTIIASCTPGQIKLSPDFAKKLKVEEGDTVGLGEVVKGDGKIFVFKGDDKVGNKLAKSGNYLQMSSANAWEELEGDEDFNRIFDAVDTVEDEDGIYIQIEFKEAKKKAKRGSSEEEEEESTKKTETENVDVDDSASEEF